MTTQEQLDAINAAHRARLGGGTESWNGTPVRHAARQTGHPADLERQVSQKAAASSS
jgi:hypothetical protein